MFGEVETDLNAAARRVTVSLLAAMPEVKYTHGHLFPVF